MLQGRMQELMEGVISTFLRFHPLFSSSLLLPLFFPSSLLPLEVGPLTPASGLGVLYLFAGECPHLGPWQSPSRKQFGAL